MPGLQPPFRLAEEVGEGVGAGEVLLGGVQKVETESGTILMRLSSLRPHHEDIRKSYGGGKDGSEVVLVVMEGGGHTWSGQPPPVGFIGKSAKNVSANDLMWEFFQKHKLK